MSCACHSVTPKNPTKGREITPDRQIYLIQRRVEVACGVAQRCKCWEVGLGMAATCWVRQYRVFTNATSPSQPEDSRGWLHFSPFLVRGSWNEIFVVIINLEIVKSTFLHFYPSCAIERETWNEILQNFTGDSLANPLSASPMPSRTRSNRPQTILFFSSSSFSCLSLAQIRHRCRYESGVPCVIHKTWRERKSQSAARQILEQTRDTFDNGIVCRPCVCTLYIVMRHTCVLARMVHTRARVCPFPRISYFSRGFRK